MNLKKSKTFIGVTLEYLLAARGITVSELCRETGISTQTFERIKKV